MKFIAIFITSALLATVTSALPTRFAERNPAHRFQGSMPPSNSPHLAHYNGTSDGSDKENYPETDTESDNITAASTSSTTSAAETTLQSSSKPPLPVETITTTTTYSIVVPTSIGSDATALA
ncbi:hypothetical protein EV359DRAFT_86929 [Lentinula novae-zelandiae]|nr:hypothetical protein EV359DRAFT_86929 [Lentinula novae-zelandiae]